MDCRRFPVPETFEWVAQYDDIHRMNKRESYLRERPPPSYLQGEGRTGPLNKVHVPSTSCHGGYSVRSVEGWSSGNHAFVIRVDGGGYLGVCPAAEVRLDGYTYTVKKASMHSVRRRDVGNTHFEWLRLNLDKKSFEIAPWDVLNLCPVEGSLATYCLDAEYASQPDVLWHVVAGVDHGTTMEVLNVIVAWSAEQHTRMPEGVQQAVMTMLLLQLCHPMVGMLPAELLHIVFSSLPLSQHDWQAGPSQGGDSVER